MRLTPVEERLARLPMEDYGLIHYDFKYDNVFYHAEQDICWVIDFDDGMYHWFAMDIQRALQSLEEDRDGLGLTGDRLQEEPEWMGARSFCFDCGGHCRF